jgi:hypothetical protein
MRHTQLALLGSVLTVIAIGGCARDQGFKAPAKSKQADAPNTPNAPNAPPSDAMASPATAVASGTVVETMNAANYTYIRVKTSSGEIWAATGQFKIAVGDKVSVPLEMPMANFRSTTLNRTFPTIYFASRIERQSGQGGPAAK